MSYTPLLATVAEIASMAKGVAPSDFDLNTTEWPGFIETIHSAVETFILNEINWIDMESSDLTAAPRMAYALKYATIMLMVNNFVHWKSKRGGQVITVGDQQTTLYSPEVYTKEVREMIMPWRVKCFGSVAPDNSGDIYSFVEGD